VLESGEESGTPVIFSADSLFPGVFGNTKQDPRRFTSLVNDVEERLFAADSHYPRHELWAVLTVA